MVASTRPTSAQVLHEGRLLRDVLSGGYSQAAFYVPTFADALLHDGTASVITTLGHTEVNKGQATYAKDGTTGAASTGDEYKFYDANGDGFILRTGYTGVIDASVFGILGDGSNETVKVQKWMDACAAVGGYPWLPFSLTVSINGVVIDERHHGLHLITDGWYKLFGAGNVQANKPSNLRGIGASFGFYLNGVSYLKGNIQVDGDYATKVVSEHIHCVGMFGGIDNELSYNFKNNRGDGLYLAHYSGNDPTELVNPSVHKNFPTRVRIPSLVSVNDDIDGRNALSIIAVKGYWNGYFYSRRHGDGGRVHPIWQPGGMDIEPNYYWQSCYNGRVDFIDTVASGTSGGLSFVGKHNPSDPEDHNIRNWSFGGGSVITESYANGQHNNIPMGNATDVDLNLFAGATTNPTGGANNVYGYNVSNCKQVKIRGTTKRTTVAIQIGCENLAGATTSNCVNIDVLLQASHFHLAARVGKYEGLNLDLIAGTVVNMGTGDTGLLEFRQAFESGSFVPTSPKSGNFKVNPAGGGSGNLNLLVYGIRNNPSNAVIPTGCKIDDSDLSGVPHNGTTVNRVLGISRFRKGIIFGVTVKAGDDALTTTGAAIWAAGDVRWFQEPALVKAGEVYNGTSWISL